MKKETGQFLPEARREGLVIQELADEVLVYDRERNKALCLNQTAALVWKHCDGKTPVSEVARALEERVHAPVDEELIWLGIQQLNKAHLLEQARRLPERGMSRRQVIRRIGLGAAVAAPLVTSILAPAAAHAATCVGNGGSCTTSAQCCSGCLCSSNVCTGSCT